MARGHKNAYTDLTAEYVRSVFNYNPKTGLLTYIGGSARKPKGSVAGTPTMKGHIRVVIDWRHYLAHRLIWLWMTGEWPEFEIDHEDENKSNNRWKNLRKATSSQNLSNRGAPINNTSGFKGVWKSSTNRWCAEIQFEKKKIVLGHFKTPQEAAKAYKDAAKHLHGQFAKT